MTSILLILFFSVVFFVILFILFFYSKLNRSLAKKTTLSPSYEPFLKDEEFKKQVLSMIPLGRLGEISDLMGPFVFLASEASSLMTGSSVLVDGGWTSR